MTAQFENSDGSISEYKGLEVVYSAQIDGGNSGGPLLLKTSDSETGCKVVGVNTWKASYRDSTNFAIPSALIQKVFAKSLTAGKGALTMDRRVQQFIDSASDEKKKYEPYRQRKRDVLIAIFAYDPIEGIRYSLAWQIWNSLQGKKDAPTISASEITEEGNMMLVTFTVGEKNEITSKWVNEHGNWKLLEYSAISSTLEMPKSIVANPYKFRVSGAYTFPITGDSSSGFQIEASYTTNFFYYGAGSQAHSAVS